MHQTRRKNIMSKITRVVLHKHGMGCFERNAKVTGDAKLELSFRHDEMDDALKSLSVVDHGGGQLAAVSYEPHPALSERLNDIKVKLPEGGGILELLGQLIGAEVELDYSGDKLKGRVLGIEQVDESNGEVAIKVDYLSLVVGDAMRRVRIADIRSITPVDAQLRRDLAILLSRMDAQRRTERRRVTLDLRGSKERDISVAYIVPATVWKTSYRVLFDEKGKPSVLGFALVDNDSQDDWEDVALSLVSGLPISFTHDLYSPRRRARPHVRVETEAPIAPPVLEGATFDMPEQDAGPADELSDSDDAEYAKERAPSKSARRSMAAGMSLASMPAPAAPPAMRAGDMAQSVNVSTRTQELGDLFSYDVSTPVSIKGGNSALVPILGDKFEGEIVAVYNERVRVGNPLTSFKLKNSTNLTLEGGPATVFREGEYSGEAMLDTMRPGEEKLVPFSVELGCKITTAFESSTESGQEVRVSSGYLYHTTWSRRIVTYTIKNATKRKLKIYIDHPADRGAEYVDTAKPAERTETFDRFVVESEPGKQLAFKITERRQHTQSLWIAPEQIENYLKLAVNAGGKKDLIKALEPLLEVAKSINELVRDNAQIDRDIAAIAQDHSRLRDNLARLSSSGTPKEKELRERYIAQLDSDETKLSTLRDRKAANEKKIAEQRKKFETTAQKINV
ncbi:hypothetical protein PLCT2_00038 [Planctomycetaceae bacterium]|nr:hypothetical protein PLCT2_00038 [Planctomycetaceae bacterium]